MWLLQRLSRWKIDFFFITLFHLVEDLSSYDINQGPNFIYEPPSVLRFSNSTGQTLTCSAHGIPPPHISWVTELGNPVETVPGLRHLLPNGTLWFPPFPPQDYDASIHHGTYKCVARNPAGIIISRHCNVRAVLWMHYSVHVYNVFVERGNVAVLQCGIPASVREHLAILGWWRENQGGGSTEIHTGGRYLITSQGNLHIKDVSKSDEKTRYQCQTKNILAGASGTRFSEKGHIIVTEPQGSVLNKPETPGTIYKVQEGGAIDLPCLAQGFPLPTYTWYKVNSVTGNQEELSATPTIFPRHTVLSVVGARRSDGGRYNCRVYNQVRQYIVEHVLEVTAPLSVRVTPSHRTVDSGHRAVLNCSVTGYPVVSVRWLKNGQTIVPDDRIRTSNTALTLEDVTREDGGMYQCIATNGDEEAQGTAEVTLGAVPPVFHFKFSELTLREGPKVFLKCIASGNPPPSITWFLDDQKLSMTDRSSYIYGRSNNFLDRLVMGQYLSPEGEVIAHLNITSVQSVDGGIYKCRARNTVGSSDHVARLNVYGQPMSRGVLNATAVSGSDVLLVCPVSGYPIDHIDWRAGAKQLKGPRPAPLSNGTLLIQKLEKMDSMQYSCTAVNKQGQAATASIFLRAIEPPKISPFAFDGDLKEDDRSQVSCTISSGDMPIDIKWEKDGLPFEPTSDVQVQNNVFSSNILFFRLKAEHSGSYTCIASNMAASTNFTGQLIVKVPPEWQIEPKDRIAKHKEAVVLDCQANGNPRPTISWRKSVGRGNDFFQYVQTSAGNVAFHPNGSLVIKSVEQEDEGFYRCEIQNGVGEISKTIFLNVEVPVYFGIGSVNRTAVVNQEAALVCNAFGDQPISISWRLGHNQIHTNTNRYEIAGANSSQGVMSTLTISKVTRTDGKEYNCVASNQHGTDILPVRLSVFEPPEPPSSLYLAEVRSRSIAVSWYPAFDGNSPVLHYIVKYKEKNVPWRYERNQTVVAGMSSAVLEDLTPNTEYQIRILSVNSVGLGPPSEIISTVTEEEAPSGPPLSVRVEAISATDLRVTWQPPKMKDQNGNILGYYIRFGELENEGLSKRTVRGEGVRDIILSKLRPFTKYQVMVNAFNKIGPGPTSRKNILSTMEGIPSGPPLFVRCDALSSTSITISWNPPDLSQQNGIILGYTVSYRLENDLEVKDTIESQKTGGEQTTVEGLGIYRSYYFKVSAFTKVGNGRPSQKIICTTAQDIPSAPEDIKASTVNSDTILVSWKRPRRGNGKILSYTLYKQNDRRISTLTIPGDERQFTFKGLVARHHYEFWVTAHTTVGEGAKSRVASQTPQAEAPARITSFSSTKKSPAGQTISLQCSAVGSPAPQLSWLHQGDVLHTSGNWKILEDGTLHVNHLMEDLNEIQCHVSNIYGEDHVEYQVKMVRPPLAPTIKVNKITTSSISLVWSQPHNGGALLQGYFLNFKKGYGEWEEKVLDYDDLQTDLANLSCGTFYSFNLMAHNIAGRSKPSATITTNTQGSIPQVASKERLLTENSTSIILHLYHWPTGGCPILYYVIEYKEIQHSAWRVVSNNLRSENEDLIVSDLSPGTWYNLKLTAHNDAGSRVLTLNFATLTLSGESLSPKNLLVNPPDNPYDRVDENLAIPLISAIIITATILLAAGYLFRKRRHFGMGRYAGYTQGNSEYSVKSLTETGKCDDITNFGNTGRVHLYSPQTLQRMKHEETLRAEHAADLKRTNNAYATLPYKTYQFAGDKSVIRTKCDSVDYTVDFQTFGRKDGYSGGGPDLTATLQNNKRVGIRNTFTNGNVPREGLSLEISCISNQQTLPISSVTMMNSAMERQAGDGRGDDVVCNNHAAVHAAVADGREPDVCNAGEGWGTEGCSTLHRSGDGRLQETRFSLPSNMFCHNDLGIANLDGVNKGDDLTGVTKFTTLNRVRHVNRRASDLMSSSDSSTESSVQLTKQAARVSRRLHKRTKSHSVPRHSQSQTSIHCRSQTSIEELGISTPSLGTADSREMTEPECDQQRRSRKKRVRNRTMDDVLITNEQLQKELDDIVRRYKEDKARKLKAEADSKFVINV